ncbi:MAG: hypothetical protein OWR52_06185 [Acidibacillus sp.]|nr:hypothetical protein [Acidibacillus sp.]
MSQQSNEVKIKILKDFFDAYSELGIESQNASNKLGLICVFTASGLFIGNPVIFNKNGHYYHDALYKRASAQDGSKDKFFALNNVTYQNGRHEMSLPHINIFYEDVIAFTTTSV